MSQQLLPWNADTFPLMLAPMQGLTNRALREVYIDWVCPDVVFTEFVRVRPGSQKVLSRVDELEIQSASPRSPLIVQLIGSDLEALTSTAQVSQQLGTKHINLNMGCPFGRMSSSAAGGGLMRDVEKLPKLLRGLRDCTQGSFSVKLRSGYSDPRQIFSLLPLMEDCGVDFLILHPRTVEQKYEGQADHGITAEVVSRTSLPVIANGDIRTAAQAQKVRELTGASGLMLGRGAIGDPLLFSRIRGQADPKPSDARRRAELSALFRKLAPGYQELFCGDTQVLNKLKGILASVEGEGQVPWVKGLKRSSTLEAFVARLGY